MAVVVDAGSGRPPAAAPDRDPDPGPAPRARPVRAPDGSLILRSDRLGVSARLPVRPLVVTLVVLALTLVVFAWSLSVG
ncbi:MAG TPA: hypothetical protein VJM49_21860, partial [Acidimicrobiales bacterium]|nr:hypothetical protein [Acidimicrobiales bacterium]